MDLAAVFLVDAISGSISAAAGMPFFKKNELNL
jgi:hypothetical protein